MVVVRAVVDAPISATWACCPCLSVLGSAFGQGLDLGSVQGSIPDAATGRELPLGNELGHVAHMAAEDRGCLLVGERLRHGVMVALRGHPKRAQRRRLADVGSHLGPRSRGRPRPEMAARSVSPRCALINAPAVLGRCMSRQLLRGSGCRVTLACCGRCCGEVPATGGWPGPGGTRWTVPTAERFDVHAPFGPSSRARRRRLAVVGAPPLHSRTRFRVLAAIVHTMGLRSDAGSAPHLGVRAR